MEITLSSPVERGFKITEEMLRGVFSEYQKQIDAHRSLGSFGGGDFILNLAEVTHQVLSIEQDGDSYRARVKILDTPKGRYLKECINEVGPDGFCCNMVGMGKVGEDGVVTEFTLTSINITPKTWDGKSPL